MPYSTRVDIPTVARHLDDPEWVIIDCRFDLADPGAGRRAWEAGHLPGARYAHLDDDLAGATGPDTGRHPLPDPARLAATLAAWGVGNETQVVVHDEGSGAIAARLWWLLRWLGHHRVAVLDGGLRSWVDAGGRLSTGVHATRAVRFEARPDDSMHVSTTGLQELLEARKCLLVDARDPRRFRGEHEPIDSVAGHVPGAVNRPFSSNLDSSGRFLGVDALRASLGELMLQADGRPLVQMCGSGVSACHNLLAMEIAGLPGGRLYPGSWSEWIRNPHRPVAVG